MLYLWGFFIGLILYIVSSCSNENLKGSGGADRVGSENRREPSALLL